jgi:hypothetical protein
VKWRFQRAANQRWRWHKIEHDEGVTRHSSASFGSYDECVADAMTAGYKPFPATSNLVALSLVHNPQPIPRILGFGVPEGEIQQANRSMVLKKRVIHPAIERMFGKNRTSAVTSKRTTSSSRSAHPVSAARKRVHVGTHTKSRTNRA